MILFDFICPDCSFEFEELVERDTRKVQCPKCVAHAERQVSAPRIDPRLGIFADSFSTMGDRWARIRQQRRKIEDKKAKEHGPEWT